MRGLMGDRYLKRFVGGILRRPRLPRTVKAELKPANCSEVLSRSGSSQTEEIRRKEGTESTETTDETTRLLCPESGVERLSDCNSTVQ